MNQTQNLQLPQWEATDRVTRADINGAFAALDGATRIATGSYVGDGTYGAEHRSSITFPFVPKLVFLGGPTSFSTSYFTIYLPQQGNGVSGYSATYALPNAALSGSTLSWYATNSETIQYNKSGFTYNWIAIG